MPAKKRPLSDAKKAENKAAKAAAVRLKKLGLISKQANLRRAEPSRRVKAKVRKFQNVLTGENVVQKVSPKVAKKLKAEGNTVVNNRVVLRKDLKVTRKGEVKSRLSGGRLFTAKGTTLREAIDEAFKKSKGKPVAFSAFGNDSYTVYYTPEAMYLWLNKYFTVNKEPLELDDELPDDDNADVRLKFFVPSVNAEEYSQLRRSAEIARQDAVSERRKKYDRDRSAKSRAKKKQDKLAKIGVRRPEKPGRKR